MMHNKKVLIHLPKNPGGKMNYYAVVKEHFDSEISFYYCGSQQKKESKLALASRMFKDYRAFYKMLKKGNYDLVVVNPTLDMKSFFRDSLFVLISYYMNVKSIVFWHGWRWNFEQKVVRKIVPYFKFTYGKADAMILLAKEFLDQVKSYGYTKKLYLETTVVDDVILQYKDAGSSVALDDEIILLFLSRVEKAKGIYETLDSFQRLHESYPNVVLQIAGTGRELERVKQYVGDRHIAGVQFLGWINGVQKAAAYKNAHIYVLASYTEGMPCSLLEAMASGLAVVTTDVGGIKDFFTEKMGVVVKTRDSADLEEKLRRLIADPNLITSMGAFNSQYAHDHFLPNQVTGRLEEIFEAVCDETTSSANFVRN